MARWQPVWDVEERDDLAERFPIRETKESPRCKHEICSRAEGHNGVHVAYIGQWGRNPLHVDRYKIRED